MFLLSATGSAMGTLYNVDKVMIRVNLRDHLPPHFHIVGVDEDCLVEIATLTIMAGTLPSKVAFDWAKANIQLIKDE